MENNAALVRCAWVGSDALYQQYHDQEWGVPVREDRHLFEMLVLEGAQAGLNWITVLRKRENYRAALDNFEPSLVANYSEARLEALLQNPGLIRNKLKIKSLAQNAQAFLQIQERHGSFSDWLWPYCEGQPIQNNFAHLGEVPAKTALSDRLSKDLKKAGFNFVGSTICYAFMQAVGMVNDHTVDCFRHAPLKVRGQASGLGPEA
ncbi:MAG: DNA-3-methyladenine glycosylase I [Microscillaceae bacterium]|nr:DNA-3-methyladenine glycosylase I [Microscillaceae bacterium]